MSKEIEQAPDRDRERIRDARLVKAGLHGDKDAFQQLVDLYHVPIYNAAYRIVSDIEVATDITQTTFLLAYERLQTFNADYKFFSWIYRIAVNESIDQCKKRRQLKQPAVEDQWHSDSEQPEDEVYRNEMDRVIQQLLMKLQEDYRVVVVLRHFSDMSYDEIAGTLEIPVKTVRSRLYSARQILKLQLQREGIAST